MRTVNRTHRDLKCAENHTSGLLFVERTSALYVRKKNSGRFGKAGENSTIWDSPSPKIIIGGAARKQLDPWLR